VDTSWLTQAGGALEHLGPDTIANAALALLYVPSGFCAGTLFTLALGSKGGALLLTALELVCGLAALVVADWLLVRFYRRTRGAPSRPPSSRADPFQTARGLEGALLWREVLDLFRNPRARLLAAVPFVLAILLKLLSARALLHFLLGPRADAALVGALTLYGALVMTSTFAQNAFGYDGGPFRALLSAPVPLEAVLRAKNRVHGGAGLFLALAVIVFCRVDFGAGGPWELVCVALAALGLVPALLLAGNFLSALFPVKFHENLERRDRLPLAAVSLGMAAALAAIAPFGWMLRHQLPGPGAALGCLVIAACELGLYRLSFPLAVRLLETRREQVLSAVSRQAAS
jgi:ABC-2 type transport system permease protein